MSIGISTSSTAVRTALKPYWSYQYACIAIREYPTPAIRRWHPPSGRDAPVRSARRLGRHLPLLRCRLVERGDSRLDGLWS
eukprot:SAG25_NODE_1053_length_4170_cov_1.592238_1_plen_81_part_00